MLVNQQQLKKQRYQIGVDMEPELIKALKYEALRRECSQSDIVRIAIKKELGIV